MDRANRRIKVVIEEADNTESDWLEIPSTSSDYIDINDHVVILFDNDDYTTGVYHSKLNDTSQVRRFVVDDKVVAAYDKSSESLTLHVGKLIVDGDLEVKGSIKAGGSITEGG